ncbi:MAG: glycoside hydrolase family 3 C-terminal domain-containing protein [Anaerolineae bacterium]|nr:glycoside hydrolase family 3 C-terminal domain-containing protein [Anaerolineae bacterium]
MTDRPFRDLNKNGKLDPYEDPTLPIEERIDDLLGGMTLEEKAGMMFHTMVMIGEDDDFDVDMEAFGGPTIRYMTDRYITHFNLVGSASSEKIARWSNALQELAESKRPGIPITLSTDPRHSLSDNPGAHVATEAFSQWPECPGLAAIGNEDMVEEFADIARQEYIAVGLRAALHPMADLATEPRWARINGTFGEDATLAARLTAAYIRGFQGEELGKHSVACMTKHFPGGGPQKDGEDPHFAYGREQVYPGNGFDYHLIPFEAAFKADTTMIMPYYGMPINTPYEAVGFGFNKDIITGLLREKYRFDGVVCTDWGLLTDGNIRGQVFPARSWGVEHLTSLERAKKALDAGVDQFGGEHCPELVVELVQSGQITEERIDVSVRRLLRDKFRLGLFDNPYVDPVAAGYIVGNPAFRAAGELAQRKSIVLLKNGQNASDKILPLQGRPRIYIEDIAPDVAEQYGRVVKNIEEADIAILRLKTPYEPRDKLFLETFFHAGTLEFQQDEKNRLLSIMEQVPTIVDIYLDRPAVIPEIASHCAGLLANFGASDAAVLDVIFGRFKPQGRLPFELPSSMAAVRQQKSDVPHDSENPAYQYGDGLSY